MGICKPPIQRLMGLFVGKPIDNIEISKNRREGSRKTILRFKGRGFRIHGVDKYPRSNGLGLWAFYNR